MYVPRSTPPITVLAFDGFGPRARLAATTGDVEGVTRSVGEGRLEAFVDRFWASKRAENTRLAVLKSSLCLYQYSSRMSAMKVMELMGTPCLSQSCTFVRRLETKYRHTSSWGIRSRMANANSRSDMHSTSRLQRQPYSRCMSLSHFATSISEVQR